jgi:hypothetical protein
MGPALFEQSLTEARAWPGAANVEHRIPNAKKAARTNATQFFFRRFMVLNCYSFPVRNQVLLAMLGRNPLLSRLLVEGETES